MSKSIVVIGGGPAGVEAAMAANRGGAKVTIVGDGPIGGRAVWHSLLPSKVWLSAADTLGEVGGIYLISDIQGAEKFAPPAIVDRIADIKVDWNQRLRSALNESEIDFVRGTAAFKDENIVEVHDDAGNVLRSITADGFIVASGSVPLFPTTLKPDGNRVIAPRFASHMSSLPKSILVIGAGPTGSESAYLFNRFGVEVTWIVDQFGVLPQMHKDLGKDLSAEMAVQGVHIVQGQMVDRLDRAEGVTAVLTDGSLHQAQMAFVAVGRKPDWARLNLAAAGLIPDVELHIGTDRFGRVGDKNIYLVGDAAGGALIANKAMAQARIAGRHASGLITDGFDPNLVVHVTYTNPQVAQIGFVENSASLGSVRVPFSSALKTHLLGDRGGYFELFYDGTDQRVRGAIALGSHAADVLSPIALAIKMKASVSDLAVIYAPHPTLSELSYIAARNV